ncbi:hypothetical protein FOMPIDRAFT_1015145 [Fomitopsis schrenkii]|uniref:Uncharacterized protein n=1 Tax=Fomitopsis schrenkii TaxID=2126942 RepID=S8FMN9_FOMSC|nr:hypothetical protein FOMPIDRAFT_1015145 [Fomitopsis schrenkii]
MAAPPNYADAIRSPTRPDQPRRVFIFMQIESPVETYDYVGDVYVFCDDRKSPSELARAVLARAKSIYMEPRFISNTMCHIYESGKALRITPRTTLLEIKRAFSNYWTAPPGRMYRANIDAMIPIMGKVDISDIKNELVALVPTRILNSPPQRSYNALDGRDRK